jgi:hypothetical protein
VAIAPIDGPTMARRGADLLRQLAADGPAREPPAVSAGPRAAPAGRRRRHQRSLAAATSTRPGLVRTRRLRRKTRRGRPSTEVGGPEGVLRVVVLERGGIPLEHCSVTDDGRPALGTTSDGARPSAAGGIAVYVRRAASSPRLASMTTWTLARPRARPSAVGFLHALVPAMERRGRPTPRPAGPGAESQSGRISLLAARRSRQVDDRGAPQNQ